MTENTTRKECIHKFMFILLLTSFALFITYYTKTAPLELLLTTTLVVVAMHIFMCHIIKQTEDKHLINIQYIILFFNLFFVPFFYSSRNIGNTALYIMPFVFIGIFLMIKHKAEGLIILLSAICTIIHKDFLFMYFNIFLYLFIYKTHSTNLKKQRNTYTTYAIICFILVCTISTYLSFTQSHKSDLFTPTELYAYRIYHIIEIPIFCIFMLPYIILGIRLFKNILLEAKAKNQMLRYALIPVMSLSSIPCLITEINYGPVFFSITTYYTLVILSLCALKDEIILEQLYILMEDIKHRYKYSSLLLVYIATVIPYYDIHINQIIYNIINWLDTNYLHLI